MNAAAEKLYLVRRFYVWIEREYEIYAGSASEAADEAKRIDTDQPAMSTVHVEESPL